MDCTKNTMENLWVVPWRYFTHGKCSLLFLDSPILSINSNIFLWVQKSAPGMPRYTKYRRLTHIIHNCFIHRFWTHFSGLLPHLFRQESSAFTVPEQDHLVSFGVPTSKSKVFIPICADQTGSRCVIVEAEHCQLASLKYPNYRYLWH